MHMLNKFSQSGSSDRPPLSPLARNPCISRHRQAKIKREGPEDALGSEEKRWSCIEPKEKEKDLGIAKIPS